jgi:serine protease Do
MITTSLNRTKKATFAVYVPSASPDSVPTLAGTGFFVSSEGHFITAHHVVKSASDSRGFILMQPQLNPLPWIEIYEVELIRSWPEFDLALLKASFDANRMRAGFEGRKNFPYLEVYLHGVEEGMPVYAYGFPLGSQQRYSSSDPDNPFPLYQAAFEAVKQGGGGSIPPFSINMHTKFVPGSAIPEVVIDYVRSRVTSAIISSANEQFAPFMTAKDPKNYVIDKPLNPGNSGGPILLEMNGHAFAVCCHFQTYQMPDRGSVPGAVVPSLYGTASSLQNIEADLIGLGIVQSPKVIRKR